jgi:protoporphyrinogen/coproporphyrinogen III oxidase
MHPSAPGAKRIVVVGGGIAGLAAAHRLVERAAGAAVPLRVTLLEASPRLGGVIDTRARDGFLLEGGPDSFLTEKPWALALCRRLGLAGEVIGTNEACRRVFVVRAGRLEVVPEGFYLLAPVRVLPFLATPIFSWRGKLRMMMELFIRAREGDADESLGDFVRRRMGREALDRLVEPMVAGIYTADPDALSLKATFPRFLEMERTYGSVTRGLRARARERKAVSAERGATGVRYTLFATLRGGMRALVDALVARLGTVEIRTGARAAAVEPGGAEAPWRVRLASGGDVAADAVILALPAHASADLLRGADVALAGLLDGIPYASTAVVNVAWRREDVPHPLDGFGFVSPFAEGRELVGVTFSSVKFAGRAPEGAVLVRAFVGGARRPDLAERDDAAMEASVRRELRELMGIAAAPLFVDIWRHPRSLSQFPVGHLDRVAALGARLKALPGLALAGNGYDGGGVPDSIRSGESAADTLEGIANAE